MLHLIDKREENNGTEVALGYSKIWRMRKTITHTTDSVPISQFEAATIDEKKVAFMGIGIPDQTSPKPPISLFHYLRRLM